MNSKANRILEMTPGQPIIVGHHSEKMARRLHEKAWDDIGKSNVKQLYDTIKDFNELQMIKLLAVLEAEKESIEIINDLVDFSKRLDEYVLDDEIFDAEAYARSLFDNGDLVVEDITDYINIDDIIDCIDLDAIGRDYALEYGKSITPYGLVECVGEPYHKVNESVQLENEEENEFE